MHSAAPTKPVQRPRQLVPLPRQMALFHHGTTVTSATGPSSTPYSNQLPPAGNTTTMVIISLAVVISLLGGVVCVVCWLLRRRTHKRRMNIAAVKGAKNGGSNGNGNGGGGAWGIFGHETDGGIGVVKAVNYTPSNKRLSVAIEEEKQFLQQVHELRRTSTLSMGTGAGTGTLHGSGFESSHGGEKMVENYRHSGDLSSLPIELPPSTNTTATIITPSLDIMHPSDLEGRRRSNISVRSSTPSQFRHSQNPPPHPSAHRASSISHNNNPPYGGPGGAGGGGVRDPYYPYGGMTSGPTSRAQSPIHGYHPGRGSMDALDSVSGGGGGHGEFYSAPITTSESFRNSQYDRPYDPSGGMSPPPSMPSSPYFGSPPPPHHHHHHHSATPSPYGYSHPHHQGGRPVSSDAMLGSRPSSMVPGSPYIPPPPPHHHHHQQQQQHPHPHNPHHRYSQQLPSPHLSYQQSPGGPQPMDRSKTVSYRHSQPYPVGMMTFQPSSPYQPSPLSPGALHPQTGTAVYGGLGVPSGADGGGGGGSGSASGSTNGGAGGHGASDSETIASSSSSAVSKAGSNAAVMIRPKGVGNVVGGGSSHTLLSVSGGHGGGTAPSSALQQTVTGTLASTSSFFSMSSNGSSLALAGSSSVGGGSTGMTRPIESTTSSSTAQKSQHHHHLSPRTSMELSSESTGRRRTNSTSGGGAAAVTIAPPPTQLQQPLKAPPTSSSSSGETHSSSGVCLPTSESKEELTEEAVMEESFQITIPQA
ncbi:hypothetical protein DFQ27_007057 [Actinomortierella ambigua]|uniref:Uncharacterized protein n=1 Tax=Actinomortierella ambigua TaxID=1343610 RepID=A0A9P6QL32_9FUNG|nr:hypothetical protein DFQ27_007057 [Actinomortierella ambigua]